MWLADYHLVEKIANFDRERIPERVVHARGASAKGFFEVSIQHPSCNIYSGRERANMGGKGGFVRKLGMNRGITLCGAAQVTHDISHLTCADFLRAPGVQTPVAVRFSTVIHERGSPESIRDPRGFAVKFYTREGNYDMVVRAVLPIGDVMGGSLHCVLVPVCCHIAVRWLSWNGTVFWFFAAGSVDRMLAAGQQHASVLHP